MVVAMQNLKVSSRDVGVDVARAIALVGMFAAHLTYPNGIGAEVLYGFPSALFAFVAGVSMAFMSQRGAKPVHFVVRGVVLIVLFFVLQSIPSDIVVVLGTLGFCMICLAWMPPRIAQWGWQPTLGCVAALTVVSGLNGGFDYSPAMWAALMIGGMAFHRVMLGQPKRLVWGAVIGLAVMAADIAARWYVPLPPFMEATGHTGGVLDVVGSLGASIGMCSLSCVLARPWQIILPRMGRMPLTLYCLHVASAAFVGFWVTVVGAAAIASVWFTVFTRGPLEELTRRIVIAGGKAFDRNNIGRIKSEEDRSIDTGSRVGRGRVTCVRDGEHHVRG